MKELIVYITKAIVDAPDAVVITEETDERGFEQKGKLLEAINRMLFVHNQSDPEGEIY